MSKNIQEIPLEKLVSGFTDTLAKETLKFLTSYGPIVKNKPIASKIVTFYIASFVNKVVMEALMRATKLGITDDAKLFALTAKDFAYIKEMIQNGVAEGFKRALSKFNGQIVDYYCIIKPVPDPVNKEPC